MKISFFTWVKPSYNRHPIVAKTEGRKTGWHHALLRNQQRLTVLLLLPTQVSVDPEAAGTRRIEHAHASLTQFKPEDRYQELFLFTLVYTMFRKPLVPIGEDELCSIFSLIVSCTVLLYYRIRLHGIESRPTSILVIGFLERYQSACQFLADLCVWTRKEGSCN